MSEESTEPARWAKIEHREIPVFKTLSQMKVYAAIKSYAGVDGVCWPSLTTLERITQIDRSSVSRAITGLVADNLLERISIGSRQGKSTTYRIGSGAGATPTETLIVPKQGSGAHATPNGQAQQVVAQVQQGSGAGASKVVAPVHQGSGAGATLIEHEENKEKSIEENKGVSNSLFKDDPGRAGKRTKAKSTQIPDVPLSLASQEFNGAWADFQQHRKDKHKPITPTSAKRLFKDFELLGPKVSIQKMNTAIANGWTGCIFPDDRISTKGPTNGKHGRAIVENLTL